MGQRFQINTISMYRRRGQMQTSAWLFVFPKTPNEKLTLYCLFYYCLWF